MLRPHLTLPGTGQSLESSLYWHDSHSRLPARPPRSPARSLPYREPRWPLCLGLVPVFASDGGRRDREPQAACGAGSEQGGPKQA